MDNVKLEEKIFSKIIHKNFEELHDIWRPSTPFSYDPNVQDGGVLSKLKTERDTITDEYKDVEIKYHISRTGHRLYPSLNQNSKKRIFCFGCSYTFGFSVPDEHTWPYQLGKLIGEDCHVKNYGVSASSVGFAAKSFYQIINSTPPENYPQSVFFLFPDPFRVFYVGNNSENLMVKHYNLNLYVTKTYEEYAKKEKHSHSKYHYATSSVIDAFFRFSKYINFIKYVASNRGIPWYWYTWNPFLYKIEKNVLEKYIDLSNTYTDDFGIVPIKFFGFGRDGSHWNGKTNQQVADIFYKLQKK